MRSDQYMEEWLHSATNMDHVTTQFTSSLSVFGIQFVLWFQYILLSVKNRCQTSFLCLADLVISRGSQNWWNSTFHCGTHLTHTYCMRRALPADSMRMTGSSNNCIVTHAPAADTHIHVTMAAVCNQWCVVKPCCQSSLVPCSTWYADPHTLQCRESGLAELFKD